MGLWATPTMTVSHFVTAMLFTLYIMAGIRFEERDPEQQFGETYREVQEKVRAFGPPL